MRRIPADRREAFRHRRHGTFLKLVAMSSDLEAADPIGEPFWVLVVQVDVNRLELTAIDCKKFPAPDKVEGWKPIDASMVRLMTNYKVLEEDTGLEGAALSNSTLVSYASAKGYTA